LRALVFNKIGNQQPVPLFRNNTGIKNEACNAATLQASFFSINTGCYIKLGFG